VLIEKYGQSIGDILNGANYNWPRYVSNWWKDIVSLDEGGGESWFNAEVSRKVNDGENTFFWKTNWRRGMSFKEKYPRLFALSTQKEAKVAEMWREGEIDVEWLLIWRRRLFVWEEELLNELMLDLRGFVRSQGEDVWHWNLED